MPRMRRRSYTRRRKVRRSQRANSPLLVLSVLTAVLYYRHVTQRVLCVVAGRPAVQFRQLHHRWSRVSLLDVDLSYPGIQVRVAAGDPTPRRSDCTDGAARTVAEWCRRSGATGGINGGFFGRERGGGRKEIVGLLKIAGVLYGRPPRHRDRHRFAIIPRGVPSAFAAGEEEVPRCVAFAHSALGFARDGRPAIDWVTSDPRQARRLLAYPAPEGLEKGTPWEINSGLSGGPRLIAHGYIAVSDHAERLVSDGLLPRTFVGYASQAGVPRYLVLGVATAMTFQDAAQFLDGYFRRFHALPCADAMSLDGGPSSQLAYRADGALYEAQASETTVPTCLLVFAPRPPGSRPAATLSPTR
jgi:hypothetical protein